MSAWYRHLSRNTYPLPNLASVQEINRKKQKKRRDILTMKDRLRNFRQFLFGRRR